MNRYREQVAAAIDAVTIRSPTRYTWLGRPSQGLPRAVDAAMDDRERRSYLVACLGQELYWSFYSPGGPVPARWGEPEPDAADAWLVEAMARANTGRGSWAEGWTVERLDGADAVVVSERLRARLPVADCRASGGALRPGSRVSLRLPKELPEQWPGFYTVISDAVEPLDPERIVRVYWNVARTGAPALVGALASRLNADGAAFRLKVANHPLRLQRCDAAILYLEGDAFRQLRAALERIAGDLRTRLEPRIPAFTLDLAPGVGLAEGRGDGESFGVTRCELLADGIVRADARGAGRLADRLDEVARRFAEERISIDAPYLEPALAGRHVL